MLKHPIERAQDLFTDLENALDEAWSVAETPAQERFCLQLLQKVQTLSGELAYEVAEREE